MEYKIKCDIEKHITANNEYEAMNSFYDELTSENDCLENHTTIEEIEKDSMTKQELISKFNGFYDEDTKEKWKDFIMKNGYDIGDLNQFFCENEINIHLDSVWENDTEYILAKTYINIPDICNGYFEFDSDVCFLTSSWNEFIDNLLELINKAETINEQLSRLDKCKNIC